MGKTKTAIVSSIPEESLKGEDKYKAKQKKKAEQKAKEEASKKVRLPGLKGGQRVVAVEAEKIETTKEKEEKKRKEQKIKKRGKRYLLAKTKVDTSKKYPLSEAIKLIKETSYSRFKGSVELNLVVKKKGLQVKANLPHQAGKAKKIEVADEATIEKLKKGKIDFDVLLSTPEMMPKLISFAKLLGPKGLMPNPKTGTIIKDKKEVNNFSEKTMNIKTEKDAPVIHCVVGKINQEDKQLLENIQAIIEAVTPKQIEKIFLKATMSPSLKIGLN